MTDDQVSEVRDVIWFNRRWVHLSLEVNRGKPRGFSFCFRCGPRHRLGSTGPAVLMFGTTIDWHTIYGEPDRIYLWGPVELIVGLGRGNGAQVWSWRDNRWTERFRWVTWTPANWRDRCEKSTR